MFDKLNSKLGNKNKVEVFRLTYAVKVSDIKIEIHYNDYPILTFYSDGDIMIDNGGMLNRGVKDRMNKFLPDGYKVQINFGNWFFYSKEGVKPYKNPVII